MIVANTIYVDGRRAAEPASLHETFEACRREGGIAWIGLYRPSEHEFAAVAREFDLHHLPVEDAIKAYQRPKLERYGDTLFVVLKAARYLEETERVEFDELHVFVGPTYVVTVSHGESPDLADLRRRLEQEHNLLRRGPEAILHAIMDRVVDDYAPVVAGLENDIDEIEEEVFAGNAAASRRIYELSREVIAFHRATAPLADMLAALIRGGPGAMDDEVARHLRDVQDHVHRVVENVTAFRELLASILTVNSTVVGLAQNEEIKRISAWAAILFAPTLIGTVYGMNFDRMPELDWRFGYPFAIGLMGLVCVLLYAAFRRRGWL